MEMLRRHLTENTSATGRIGLCSGWHRWTKMAARRSWLCCLQWEEVKVSQPGFNQSHTLFKISSAKPGAGRKQPSAETTFRQIKWARGFLEGSESLKRPICTPRGVRGGLPFDTSNWKRSDESSAVRGNSPETRAGVWGSSKAWLRP